MTALHTSASIPQALAAKGPKRARIYIIPPKQNVNSPEQSDTGALKKVPISVIGSAYAKTHLQMIEKLFSAVHERKPIRNATIPHTTSRIARSHTVLDSTNRTLSTRH